jgi:hypothetical protein
MMDYYVIATDDVKNVVKYDCLVAFMNDFNDIQKCWKISVYDGEVDDVETFEVKNIQSFYAHSSGMYSCKLPCPDYIKKVIKDA